MASGIDPRIFSSLSILDISKELVNPFNFNRNNAFAS